MFNTKTLKRILVLVLIGFIFSGGDYSNPRTFALSSGGGGGIDSGGAGLGVGGAVGIAGIGISAINTMSKGCGVGIGSVSFGGKIQKVCPCKFPPVGKILIIGPPNGGHFYFGPRSRAFIFGRIIPGVWSVGVSGTVVTCFESLKPPKPMSGNRILIVGTN